MKTIFSCVGLLILFTSGMVAENSKGISPRPSPSDYAEVSQKEQFSLGGSAIPRKEIPQNFSTDLTKGFIVVEIGLYPQDGAQIEANRKNFVLKKADGSGIIRPIDPQTIAKVRRGSEGSGRDVVIYPTVGVGYETGGGHYDPYDGRNHGGGWSTGVGVGVGVGPSGRGTSPEDRQVMQTELNEKEFPDGIHTKPVCGYLYFPVSKDDQKKSYLLEGELAGEKISLLLKADKGK
jgi:hypothetical protein